MTLHWVMPRMVVLVVILAGTWCAAAETEVPDVPVRIGRVQGFGPSGAGWVALHSVIDLRADKPVRLELETPDHAVAMKLGEVELDGKRITVVERFERLVFHVLVDKPRQVYLWARIRHRRPAAVWTNGYQWSSVREFKEQQKDPAAEQKRVAGLWRWVCIRSLRLAPGVTALELKRSHPGLPEMDTLVVTSEKTPPKAEDTASPTTAPPSWVVESDDIELPGAVRLSKASLVGPAGGRVEVSTDAGKTWSVPDAVPLQGRLRLRCTWTKPPKVDHPVQGFRAGLTCDREKVRVVQDNDVRVIVDMVTPGVFRLEGKHAGAAVSAPPKAPYLYALEPKQPGKPWPDPQYGKTGKRPRRPDLEHWLRPQDGTLEEVTETKSSLSMTHGFYDGTLRVTATVDLKKDRPDQWTLAFDNRSTWDILTWTFPRLGAVRVGSAGYDDHWLNTNLYGPWPAGHGAEDRPYPGWGALGFVDLWDNAAGLALMNTELRQGIVNFKLRPAGPDVVNLETERMHRAAAGTATRWTYRILPHRGDWHVPADVYGDWFRSVYGTADHWPAWVRDSNGWLSDNACLQDASFRWANLLDTLARAQKIGIDHIQVWGQFGSSSCASFWWPSPKYGPIDEFARVNREIRQRGGHVGYYLMYDRENRYNLIDEKTYDGYLPQSAYPEGVPILPVPTFVKGHLVRDPEGRITAWPQTDKQWEEFRANLAKLHDAGKTTTWARNTDGTFPGGSMAKMNPDDPDWQRWLVRWTNGLYQQQWNCDTAYQDVLGCGRVGRSFDLRRGDHGNIPNGNEDIARQLTETGQKHDPNWVLSAEGKSELVTRWAMGMTSNQHYGWIDLHAHRYTHPDHILFLGGANGGYRQMAHNCDLAYLYGAKFELILTGKINRVKRTVLFRETIKPLFFNARYRDTVGLDVKGDRIRATRHDWVDERNRLVTVAVVNPSGTDDGKLTVDLQALPVEPVQAVWVTDDWTARTVPMDVENGKLTLSVPTTRVNALLLVERTEPRRSLYGGVVGRRRPGGLDADVWSIRLPSGSLVGKQVPPKAEVLWKDKVVATPTLEQLVESRTLELDLDDVDEGFLRLRLDDRPVGFHYIEPMVVDGSFERRGGTPADDAPDGRHVARLGPAQGWSGTHRGLNLEGGYRYRLSVSARRTGTDGQMYGLIRLMDDAGKWHYTRLSFPKDRFNEWVTLTAEFAAPKVLTAGNIYLYNMNSRETVWYDAVTVEMLGR